MAIKLRRRKSPTKFPQKRRSVKKFMSFERAFTRFSREMISDLQKVMNAKLGLRLELLASSFKAEKESKIAQVTDADDAVSLNDLIDGVEAQFLGFYSRQRIEQFLKGFFRDIGIANDLDLNREFAKQNIAIGPSADQLSIINNAVTQVTNRIKGIQSNLVASVRAEIAKGVANGDRWEEVAKRLATPQGSKKKGPKTPFVKGLNEARFIARNAVSETLGELNKDRQVSAGVNLYTWQTAEDERVRPTHERLNGRQFSWTGTVTVDGVKYQEAVDPTFSSSGTIPGQPWNCRCVALPFIPELDDL